jgi:dienelactone hydrolase
MLLTILCRAALLIAVLLPLAATAQSQAEDLTFPTEAATISMFTRPQMALYKPDGPGPFPALVLMHQCGGLGNGRWQNLSMLDWARQGVAQGYVVMVVDALGPRNVDSVCMGPKGGVTFNRGARDAMQAAEHLRKLPYVDGQRVALAGYSWGAMVGLLTSSDGVSKRGENRAFGAIVSFYPGCFTLRPANGSPYELIQPDIGTPLLVLMGSADTETPAAECVQKLEPLRASGAPIELHVYPDTTHCWDCKNLDGFTKTDVRGNRVQYRYSEAVTIDASQHMFSFLSARLGSGTR